MKLLSLKVLTTGFVYGELQDAYREPQWDITLFKFSGRSSRDLTIRMRVNRGSRHYWRSLRPDERPDVKAAISSEVETALYEYRTSRGEHV